MTGSAWLAEETVQEVFLRVWMHREKLPVIKDHKAWLSVIARRIVFNQIRQLHKQRRYAAYHSSGPTATSQCSDALLALRADKLMEAALRELTTRQRQAYQLCFLLGHKKENVAAIMQITEVTATHHLKAASATVKKFIYRELQRA